MKQAVFLLALANLLFFAFAQGYFGRPDNPDAIRLQKQINPERIVVVGRGEPPGEKSAEKPAADENGKAPVEAKPAAEAAKPAGEPAKTVEAPKAAEACVAWSGLATAEADRLAALLGEKFDDFKLARRSMPVAGGAWWVSIPPLANKAEADKKAGELRKLGVTDFFIIHDAGPDRWAISLGVFSTENGARERLAALKEKGVRSAKLGARSGKEGTFAVEARGPADRQKALQEAVTALSPSFKVKACQ